MKPLPARLAALVSLGIVLLAPPEARAVNLVPNASFESYTSCPTSFGQTSLAAPWDAPTAGTSDYLNACAPAVFPAVSVPANMLGNQAAHTGVGYAGLIPRSSAPDYREYVAAPLLSPLATGATYLVRFYVSLADTSLLALDRLGAYLSVGPVGPLMTNTPLPFTPQVENPAGNFLIDPVNWMLVSGMFVAAGGEDHIVIGNFHDDANTATVPGPGNWPGGAYYYIDDVSVELVPPALQACCSSDNVCSMQFPGECQLAGGTPAGPGTTCTPSPCTPTKAARSSWGGLKTIYR